MSNLSVSYITPTANMGAATGTAAPAAAGEAGANPLGFLGALLDQLLGAAAPETGSSPALATAGNAMAAFLDLAAPAAAKPMSDLLSRLDAVLDGSGDLDALMADLDGLLPEAVPADLVAALHERLTALAADLTESQPDIAVRLGEIADHIAPVADEPVDPDEQVIAAILTVLLGVAQPPPSQGATAAPATPEQQVAALLSRLGIEAPAVAPATPTDVASPLPPDQVRLANQLAQVATALADAAPEFAAKLQALSVAVTSAEAGTDLVARLTAAASNPDPNALRDMLRSLSAPPQTAPQPVPPPLDAASLTVPAPLLQPVAGATVARKTTAPPVMKPATDTPAIETKAKAAVVAEATRSNADASDPAVALQTPAAQQAAAKAIPGPYQAAINPINMGQVAFEIARQVSQGTSRFTIRLDPPELGRVDVKLQLDGAGSVNARLTVERAETLDLFQRDQRALERALAQAGLDPARTSLEFSLRQQTGNPSGGQQQNEAHPSFVPATASDNAEPTAPIVTLYRGIASAGGVNIIA